jgi:hypothetical protein
MLKEGIKTRSTSWRKEYSCLYSFLQLVLLVFIPSFSMYFLFLFLPSTCTSCFYSEGIQKRSTSWRKEYKQELQAVGRNKNKKHTQKDGLKTRSTCWRKE